MSSNNTTKINQTLLRNLILKHFSLDEIKTLCIDININFDELEGLNLTSKVRELISFLERRDELINLITEVQVARPNVKWPFFNSPQKTKKDSQELAKSSTAGKEYFVGHQLTNKNIRDLRNTISKVFNAIGYKPYYPEKSIGGQTLLYKVTRKVFSSHFCIFDISSTNPNVFIELGVALALNRFVLMTAREGVKLPNVLQTYGVIRYSTLQELEKKLQSLCENGFPPSKHTWSDYCYFCDKICSGIETAEEENSFLLLDYSPLLWLDLKNTFNSILSNRHIHAVNLSDNTASQLPPLSEMRRKVLSTQFSICDIGKSNNNSYIALGIAIGSRKPWLLLNEKGNHHIPSNLNGFERLEYEALADFDDELAPILNGFLDFIMPSPNPKPKAKTVMHVPFWIDLDNWIHSQTKKDVSPEFNLQIEGQIRIIRIEDNSHVATYYVPETGLLVGRNDESDINIPSPIVSGKHFRIIRGGQATYFVVDLGSSHGTFLNGKRLTKNKPLQLKMKDEILIQGGFVFYVWDYRPLDLNKLISNELPFEAKSSHPSILKIDLVDVRIPSYLDSINQKIVINLIHPDSSTVTHIEVQNYYPFRRILEEVVLLLQLPNNKQYVLIHQETRIDGDATPLLLGIRSQTFMQIISVSI